MTKNTYTKNIENDIALRTLEKTFSNKETCKKLDEEIERLEKVKVERIHNALNLVEEILCKR